MEKIYKYPLAILEEQVIELPLGSDIVRVDVVEGIPSLWARVNVFPEGIEFDKELRYIELYKTGQEFKSPSSDLKYLGFMSIFIMQELGLYVYENLKKYEVRESS